MNVIPERGEDWRNSKAQESKERLGKVSEGRAERRAKEEKGGGRGRKESREASSGL